MEFLRSLLRRRFARAQVATSRNIGCFLRLIDFLISHFVIDRINWTSYCTIQDPVVQKVDNAIHQAPVVQKVDSAIHWINRYPLDKY